MQTPKSTIATLDMARVMQRLTLPALAAKLGVPVDELVNAQPDPALANRLGELSATRPAPLKAVADVVGGVQAKLRKDLLDDARQLANKRLALEGTLPYMQERWEVFSTALNELREHVKGTVVSPQYSFLPVGDYKAARFYEAALVAAVEANDRAAQARKSMALEQAKAGLHHIRQNRLPEYEAEFGTLDGVHDLLNQHDEHLATLQAELATYKKAYALLMANAPLQIDAQGQDMSLKAQNQNGAKAQQLVEAAIAAAKAEQREQERVLRQGRKARELEVFNEHFDKVLAQLEAGQAPEPPSITAKELGHDQLKGSAETPKAPNANDSMPLPKVPRVKGPASPKASKGAGAAASKAESGAAATKAPHTGAAPQSIEAEAKAPATKQATKQATPQAAKSSAPTQGAKAAEAQHIHTPAAPETVPQTEATADEETEEPIGFKDDGWRPKHWTKADEALFQKHFARLGGVFPSRGKFKRALKEVMATRLEGEKQLKRLLSGTSPPT